MKHCPLLVLRYLFGMLNLLFGKRLRNFIGVGNNVVLTAKSSPHNHVQLQLYKCDYAAYLSYIFVCIHGMIIACVFNLDEARKEDLVTRRLWEKSNMERYIAETRKESKRRR